MTARISTIHELDSVEILVGLPDVPLEDPEAGDAPLHTRDRGVVVFVFDDGRAFAGEFFRGEETVAIADVTPNQIRLMESHAPTSDKKEVLTGMFHS